MYIVVAPGRPRSHCARCCTNTDCHCARHLTIYRFQPALQTEELGAALGITSELWEWLSKPPSGWHSPVSGNTGSLRLGENCPSQQRTGFRQGRAARGSRLSTHRDAAQRPDRRVRPARRLRTRAAPQGPFQPRREPGSPSPTPRWARHVRAGVPAGLASPGGGRCGQDAALPGTGRAGPPPPPIVKALSAASARASARLAAARPGALGKLRSRSAPSGSGAVQAAARDSPGAGAASAAAPFPTAARLWCLGP
ncbi:unnamed protein product [Natator depressus]